MKNFKFKKSQFTKWIFSMAVLSALTACPPSKNTEPHNYTDPQSGNGYQNCANCAGLVNGQEFLATESQEYNNLMTVRLGFGGATASGGGFGYNPSQYTGPVAVSRGEIIVLQNHYQGYCSIPAGIYSVRTISSGQYYSGIITNLRLVASGPVNLEIGMNSAQISSYTNRDFNSMQQVNQRLFSVNTVIETMNGQYCRSPIILR